MLRGNAGILHCPLKEIVWMPCLSGLKILSNGSAAGSALAWPDTRLSRTTALTLIETLNARLLAAHSATATLEQWAADHKLASNPIIRAKILVGVDKLVSDRQRQRLQIGPNEPVKYRRVELACGERVLSEAENWYVPSRLTPEITAILETTDTPFGRAVLDLKPVRETFAVEMFWQPLRDGSDVMQHPFPERPEVALFIPWRLFQHSAQIYGAEHKPFAEVNETYTREILAFGAVASE
jgi:chorismate-pyruvate lyase